jgi:K+-sensing histidine kinase KdpD
MVKLSRYYSTALYFIVILIIGMIDYYTTYDITFLLFYLIPIMLIAQQKGVKTSILISSVLLSSFFWAMSDYDLQIYMYGVGAFAWNCFVRFFVFSLTSYLISNLKREYDKIFEINKELEKKNKFIEIALQELMDKRKKE